MRADALEAALARDLAAGVVPVAVVATAGTTLTGAVDPLDAIADVCERHGVWLHIDGAYGLPPRPPRRPPRRCSPGSSAPTRPRSTRTSGSGCRRAAASCCCAMPGRCSAAFGHEERYMLHEGDVANPVDRTLEYSRPLRSLRLWMAFRVTARRSTAPGSSARSPTRGS